MREILVLGDSHTPVFNHPLFTKRFPEYHFNVFTVVGATASGLENPNSKTQAYPLFKHAIKTTKAKIVIVMLGEVDTGFVIWWRAHIYKESVTVMMNQTIDSYTRFLNEIKSRFEVICISTPLPTIQDNNDWGEIANARREVTATLKERTQLTLKFNKIIQEFCVQSNIKYLMLDNLSLGQNGTVKRQLLNSDHGNHHYDTEQYAQLLTDNLIDLLN